jgi:acyl transferase domain-containing protein
MTVDTPAPIDLAIIGLSHQVPGPSSASEFLQLLNQDHGLISADLPKQQLGVSSSNKSGRFQAQCYSAFLQEIFGFDTPCFGIRDDETKNMDPRLRVAFVIPWSETDYHGIVSHGTAGKSIGWCVDPTRGDISSFNVGSFHAYPAKHVLPLRSVIAGKIVSFHCVCGS